MANKDNVYCNTNQRLFYLSDNIDNNTIGAICSSLLSLIEQDDVNDDKEKNFERKPIKIYINSHGGAIHDMWALIDIISCSKTPIYTYCTGYAMSAAFQIYLSGHKRYASKHATFLYHQFIGYRYGKYQDLVEDRGEMDYINQSIEEYVMSRTKIKKKLINEVREQKKDLILHIDKALELGVVDEVM